MPLGGRRFKYLEMKVSNIANQDSYKGLGYSQVTPALRTGSFSIVRHDCRQTAIWSTLPVLLQHASGGAGPCPLLALKAPANPYKSTTT
jgi:hypothetical protein